MVTLTAISPVRDEDGSNGDTAGAKQVVESLPEGRKGNKITAVGLHILVDSITAVATLTPRSPGRVSRTR